MFNKYLVGNEKAIIGGLSAGVLSILGQLGVNNQLTLKEGVYGIVAWLVTHIVIWVSTNTKPTPPSPGA